MHMFHPFALFPFSREMDYRSATVPTSDTRIAPVVAIAQLFFPHLRQRLQSVRVE
jgi:hypothetical protein